MALLARYGDVLQSEIIRLRTILAEQEKQIEKLESELKSFRELAEKQARKLKEIAALAK